MPNLIIPRALTEPVLIQSPQSPQSPLSASGTAPTEEGSAAKNSTVTDSSIPRLQRQPAFYAKSFVSLPTLLGNGSHTGLGAETTEPFTMARTADNGVSPYLWGPEEAELVTETLVPHRPTNTAATLPQLSENIPADSAVSSSTRPLTAPAYNPDLIASCVQRKPMLPSRAGLRTGSMKLPPMDHFPAVPSSELELVLAPGTVAGPNRLVTRLAPVASTASGPSVPAPIADGDVDITLIPPTPSARLG